MAARNQATGAARAGGGLVHVSFDRNGMVQLATRVQREVTQVSAASRVAHEKLAARLQEDIARTLEDAVDERGREQRRKSHGAHLADAIRDPNNRRVDNTGYTVGYLDQNSAVRPYYRNLEEGTTIFRGRYLKGLFYTGDGAARVERGPRGGRRAILESPGYDAKFGQEAPWRRERAYVPGMRVRNEIEGYHYFEGGERRFRAEGGTRELALEAYRSAFSAAGLSLISSSLSGPTRSGSTF